MNSQLTQIQQQVLDGLFRHTQALVLSGGGALVGFYLGHRLTNDLDLFTTQVDGLEQGERALASVALEIGASLESVQTAPDFRRRVVRRGSEFVVVDLVRDPTSSLLPMEQRGRVILESASEILANKLCTALSRAELRDLVDLMALERAGLRVEDALPLAARKDGGATPGQLAWVLSMVEIGPDARIPGGVTGTDLQEYVKGLVNRLAAMAAPKP